MRLLEGGRLEEAVLALAPLTGPSRLGAIARFRRAEALSRMGRHDEAVEEARQAVADDSVAPAPSVWLAGVLAEAGQYDGAAAVEFPATSVEPLDFLRAGFAALGRIARGEREGADATAAAVLETRHSPIYSLALRLAEADRLASETRWPDPVSSWYALDCRRERAAMGQAEHEPTPPIANPRQPHRGEAEQATRWLRLHGACDDHSALVRSLRRMSKPPPSLDEVELEVLLAAGELDEADVRAKALTEKAGKKAGGELAVDRARLAQLRGEAVTVREFPGHKDAQKRLRQYVDWTDLGAALLSDRPLDARELADRLADPSHREFVEAALTRWAAG